MVFLGRSPKITPKKLATQLRRLIFPERPIKLISTSTFKAVSKLIGEERTLDEIACLLCFAAVAGLTTGLEEVRQRELVRQAFIESLRSSSGSGVLDMMQKHILEYQKAISDAPDDRNCVGWRFVQFCGLEHNAAIAVAANLVFWSMAGEASELVEKYEILI